MALKIFIVEDNELYSFFLQYNLGQNMDFRIDSFKSGAEFLSAIKNEKPDVLIIDHNLPDINGDSLLKQTQLLLDGTRVIVLTSSKDDKLREMYRGLSVNNFIQKEKEALTRLLPNLY